MKRGRSGLYRRDGVFAFRYKTASGDWREKYTGFKSWAEAKEFKDDFLEALSRNALPTKMALWKLDAAEKWWIDYRHSRIAPATLNSERYRLQHLIRVLGNLRLQEIENHHLDSYQAAEKLWFTSMAACHFGGEHATASN